MFYTVKIITNWLFGNYLIDHVYVRLLSFGDCRQAEYMRVIWSLSVFRFGCEGITITL